MNVFEQLKNQWKYGGYGLRILYINIGVYVSIILLDFLSKMLGLNLAGWLLNNLIFHAKIEELIWRPWVIITANFTHESFWHIFWNMVIFYYISQIFTQLIGQRKLVSVYLAGGIACCAVVLFSYYGITFRQFQNPNGLALGASGSIYAVFVYLVMHRPKYQVYLFGLIKVPIFVIAIFYLLSDINNIRSYGDNFGGSFGHLGGALYGFISYYAYTKGKNLEAWIENILDRKWNFKSVFGRKEKLKVKYKRAAQTKSNTRDDASYNKSKKEQQEVVDAILDKISKYGYDGLSKEEKAILFDASKRK